MKSQLKWLNVANDPGVKQINRQMTDKEIYVYWFNVFMYDPTESLEKLLDSFITHPSTHVENQDAMIQTIKDVLKERE